jgi:hypothetical protein
MSSTLTVHADNHNRTASRLLVALARDLATEGCGCAGDSAENPDWVCYRCRAVEALEAMAGTVRARTTSHQGTWAAYAHQCSSYDARRPLVPVDDAHPSIYGDDTADDLEADAKIDTWARIAGMAHVAQALATMRGGDPITSLAAIDGHHDDITPGGAA